MEANWKTCGPGDTSLERGEAQPDMLWRFPQISWGKWEVIPPDSPQPFKVKISRRVRPGGGASGGFTRCRHSRWWGNPLKFSFWWLSMVSLVLPLLRFSAFFMSQARELIISSIKHRICANFGQGLADRVTLMYDSRNFPKHSQNWSRQGCTHEAVSHGRYIP